MHSPEVPSIVSHCEERQFSTRSRLPPTEVNSKDHGCTYPPETTQTTVAMSQTNFYINSPEIINNCTDLDRLQVNDCFDVNKLRRRNIALENELSRYLFCVHLITLVYN